MCRSRSIAASERAVAEPGPSWKGGRDGTHKYEAWTVFHSTTATGRAGPSRTRPITRSEVMIMPLATTERVVALAVGLAAWLGVAIVSVLVVNAWNDENQVLAFIPIAASVVVAWAVGEWVTDRLFGPTKQ